MTHHPTTFGCIEQVSMPQFGIIDCVAKIDTGAYSGAMHCDYIREHTRESDGRRVLRFVPSTNKSHTQEVTDYEVTQVRSSTGHLVQRYLISTEIQVKGVTYPITIGLSDRRKMQREVLIGRRFLREHGIVVDVRINQQYDTDGGEN